MSEDLVRASIIRHATATYSAWPGDMQEQVAGEVDSATLMSDGTGSSAAAG